MKSAPGPVIPKAKDLSGENHHQSIETKHYIFMRERSADIASLHTDDLKEQYMVTKININLQSSCLKPSHLTVLPTVLTPLSTSASNLPETLLRLARPRFRPCNYYNIKKPA